MNKSEIIKDIKTELLNSRNFAIATASANNYTALLNDEYASIVNSIGRVNFDIARAEYTGADTSKLTLKLNELNKTKIEMLHKLNLTEQDLTAKFKCKLCEDTGVYNSKVCTCLSRQYTEKLKELCGNKLDTLLTFDKFDSSIRSKDSDMVKACNLLKQIADKYPNINYNNILLSGQVGIGKTFLTQALANELIKKGVFTLFISSFALNQNFLNFHTSKDKENNITLDTLFDCDLLIIDDLGTEPMYKNVTMEYLILLLNERIQNNKMTVISTNLTIDKILAHYGERIFSRLIDKRHTLAFDLKGDDLRIKR